MFVCFLENMFYSFKQWMDTFTLKLKLCPGFIAYVGDHRPLFKVFNLYFSRYSVFIYLILNFSFESNNDLNMDLTNI